jgi:hypothetical protein
MNSIDEKGTTTDEENANGPDILQEEETGKDVGTSNQVSKSHLTLFEENRGFFTQRGVLGASEKPPLVIPAANTIQ